MTSRLVLLAALVAASAPGHADEPPRSIFRHPWRDGARTTWGARYWLTAEKYQRNGGDFVVRDFPTELLRDADEGPPVVVVPPASCGRDAPCVWAGPVVVASVSLETTFLTVDRARLGAPRIEWTYAHRIGQGNYRFTNGRRSWWVCRSARWYQIAARYPEDPADVRQAIRRFSGFEPDDHDIEERVFAARELNGDIEAYLARGMTLEESRLATMRTAIAIATQLGMAYFKAFASAQASLELARDVGADMDTALDLVRAKPAPREAVLEAAELERIVSMEKGSRPNPATYLPRGFIDTHLAPFKQGVTKFAATAPSGNVGAPRGTFVMPKSVANRLIAESHGDPKQLETILGMDPGTLGTHPMRIDIAAPAGLRMPSGNEPGANGQWLPGGFTKGGIPEAVIDPVGRGAYTVSAVFDRSP